MDKKRFDNLYKGAQPIQFEFAKRMRKEPTETESILWTYLSNQQMQGLKFRRQHPIDNFILDFYCHQIKFSIELDGEIHKRPNQIEYDNERSSILSKHGIFEIRFTNKNILENLNGVLTEIEKTIRTLIRTNSDKKNPAQ